MTSLNECVDLIVKANRILANERVVDALGHISCRHPDDPTKFLLSRSRSPALVEAGDIQTFNLDGTLLGDDTRRPYLERFIHGAVYESRPEVFSVVHDHSMEVLPFSVSKTPLRPILHTSGIIGEVVPVWDIRDKWGDTNMLVSSIDQGRDLAKTMGQNVTALMRGHGAVVAAPNIVTAVLVAIYLNINASALFNAIQLGPVTYMTPGEVKRSAEDALVSPLAAQRAWDYFLMRAGYKIV